MAAYHLAKGSDIRVAVEKGYLAGEQSSRNWGWCRQHKPDRASRRSRSARARDLGRVEPGARRRNRLSRHRAGLCDQEPVRSRRLVELDRSCARTADAQPHAFGRRGQGHHDAGQHRGLDRRPALAHRRQGRAGAGGAGDRRRRAPAGRDDPSGLRGTRARDRCRTRQRGQPDERSLPPPAPARCSSPAACGPRCSAATTASRCRSPACARPRRPLRRRRRSPRRPLDSGHRVPAPARRRLFDRHPPWTPACSSEPARATYAKAFWRTFKKRYRLLTIRAGRSFFDDRSLLKGGELQLPPPSSARVPTIRRRRKSW